jgi:hypothetical protein
MRLVASGQPNLERAELLVLDYRRVRRFHRQTLQAHRDIAMHGPSEGVLGKRSAAIGLRPSRP